MNHANGKYSSDPFHKMPVGMAVFPKSDGGGSYYISNAEVDEANTLWQHGGVRRLEFDKNGNVVVYKKIANNMKMNW